MTKEQEQELQELADASNKAAEEYRKWKELDDKLYADDISYKKQLSILLRINWLKVWGELTPERQKWCMVDFGGTPWDILHQIVEQTKEIYWSAFGAYQDKHFDYCGWCAW